MPLLIRSGLAEELHLHLFKLTRTKDEVAGGDLVPERLSYLGDAKRDALAGGCLDVVKVDEDALRRLRAQVYDRSIVLYRTHKGLEQQVELTRFRKFGLAAVRALVADMVRTEPAMATTALYERVREVLHVAARHPYLGTLEDRRVQPDDVIPVTDHRLPPHVLDITLQLHAQRSKVPGAAKSAVDFRGLEDKAAPLGEANDCF